MELKYYLRGLGLGIAITAIVMGIASSKSKTMTNEEIIARAKQLGMTENTVLDEISRKDDTDDSANSPTNISNSDTSQNSDNTENVANASNSGENEDLDVLGRNSQAGTRKTDSSVDAEAGDTGPETDSPDAESKAGVQDAETKAGVQDADTKTDSTDADAQTGASEAKPTGTDTAASDKPMVITVGSGDGSYSVSKKLADVGAIESAGDFDNFLCNNGYDKKIRTGTYTIPANASEEQMARIITGAE